MDEYKKKTTNLVNLGAERRRRTERWVDLTLADLQGLKGTPLGNLVEQAEEAWLGDDPDRIQSVRCCTAVVSNHEGLGEIKLTFRFPFKDPVEKPDEGRTWPGGFIE